MGATSSQPELVSDLSQLDAFKGQPKGVQEHFQSQVDGMLALAVGFEHLCNKIDRNFLAALTKAERARLRDLDQEKESLLLDISKFLKIEKYRYLRIQREVREAAKGSNLASFLKNSKPAEQVKQLQSLCLQLKSLKAKYSELHNDIQNAMTEDGRMGKRAAKCFLAALCGVAAACGAALLIVAHFVPGLNIVLLIDDVALIAVGSALCAAVAIKCLTQDEAQRGLAYLEKVEASLLDLQHQIVSVDSMEEVLSDDGTRECWEELVKQILAQIDRVLGLCEQTSLP